MFGFGARSIAFIDTAAASPFAQLSMIPLLTLIAFYAPAGHRATWFALMASLMNMALVAGQLQTKYLNHVFVVERGDYGELGVLLIAVTILGFVIPICAILAARPPYLRQDAACKRGSELTSLERCKEAAHRT